MKIRLSLILIVIAGLCSQILNAGQLGSFDSNIFFNDENRTISCYVTQDYVEDVPANLVIGLHGAGDNSANYRNALIQYLLWNEILPNTVMIFPDAGDDQSRDFYAPEGDELIIDSVIAWAKQNYNIDESKIILQGFSLGGRSALKYGLDNKELFAGLVLHTPAMQSPYDVQNTPDFSLIFDYAACGNMPISIVHGTEDYGFLKTVALLADSLVAHNAKLMYLLMPGLTHSVPPNSVSEGLFKFITEPIDKAVSILHKLSSPAIVDENKIKLTCIARNIGNTAITSMSFQYELNGEIQTFDWTGNLTNENNVDVELELTDLNSGYYQCKMFATMINGETVTENAMFNSLTHEFRVYTESKLTPFHETFSIPESLDENWSVKESGNYISWMYDDVTGLHNPGSMVMLNTILAYENYGLIESLYSNRFDYSPDEIPAIAFDLAFNFTEYGPPYFTENITLTDTLEILMSNDNWETSVSVFKEWGADLATYAEPFFNKVSIQDFLYEPLENQWKNIEINLSEFETSDKTMFRFDYISGSGGLIYLDNFQVYDKADVSVEENIQAEFSVYPNPATANQYVVVKFVNASAGDISISLFNSSGQKAADLYTGTCAPGENAFSLSVPNLAVGMYIVKATISGREIIGKLVIK